jgi:hypothetical protein
LGIIEVESLSCVCRCGRSARARDRPASWHILLFLSGFMVFRAIRPITDMQLHLNSCAQSGARVGINK